MGTHPATFPDLDDTQSNTRQVKSDNSQDQDQAFQSFRRREFTGLNLVPARFFIQKGFFNVKTQAVLVQGPGVAGFVTHHMAETRSAARCTRVLLVSRKRTCHCCWRRYSKRRSCTKPRSASRVISMSGGILAH